MEIKCKKTPTTGIQIFVDGEYLTSFSYHSECDELIDLLENAQNYKDKCALAKPPLNESVLTISDVSNSVCDCKVKEPCTFTEHGKIVEKCVNCGKPIANDC